MKFISLYKNILTKQFLEHEYIVKRRSIINIANEINCSTNTIYAYLRKYGIEVEKRNGEIKPGQKFNKLTAIKVVSKSKNGTFIWECLCDCGNISKVRTCQLKNNTTKSCGCICGKSHANWSGYKDISGNFFSGVKSSAKTRNINFNITIEDIWNLYLNQNKKCYLSNIEIHFNQYKETASVDRINSLLDYNINNIAICHKDINKIKASFLIEDFIKYCRLISCFNSKFKAIEIDFNLSKSYFKDLKYNAKRRGKDFYISIEDIGIIFKKQGGVCALTGLELTFPTNSKDYRNRIHNFSVDRIDNKLGYYINNIQIVHKLINQSRKDLEIDYYKELCQKISLSNN